MKITFRFDRNKPFAEAFDDAAPAELVERYRVGLASAFAELLPVHEIVVEAVDAQSGDVEFDPPLGMPDKNRLEVALDMRRVAHRIADAMLAELYVRENGEARGR